MMIMMILHQLHWHHYHRIWWSWWISTTFNLIVNVYNSTRFRFPTRPSCCQSKTQREEWSVRWLRSTGCPSPRRPTTALSRATCPCPRTGRRGWSSGAAPPGNTYLTMTTVRSTSSWTIRLDISFIDYEKLFQNYEHLVHALCFWS